ncbi:hypothetical protein Ccrd_025884 [Cynara cardunculus var. scolymus]|uniref:Uncharacterized protein n=1 Tax=Cynara cardunculus var. scolymus TaxID=59895 RepID=A0A124RPP9_CYNCS|nr:hypothetical protein Ccrd_025884 [Cynara cardunculus var. scolymus]
MGFKGTRNPSWRFLCLISCAIQILSL